MPKFGRSGNGRTRRRIDIACWSRPERIEVTFCDQIVNVSLVKHFRKLLPNLERHRSILAEEGEV